MSKEEHGARLAAAMAAKRLYRRDIADATGKGERTVTNWTTGKTMPDPTDMLILRKLLGEYDLAGDPVDVALRQSALVDWRRSDVWTLYQKHLYEQAASGEERGA